MKIRFLLILTMVIVSAVSLNNRSARAAGTLYLRMAHLSADAPALDIYLDGKKVIDNLKRGVFTDFIILDAKKYDVTVRKAGDAATAAALFSKQIDLQDGTWVNLIALGLIAAKDATAFDLGAFLSDHRPTNGKARVEFVNGIPGLDPIDIYINGKLLFANVAFNKAIPAVDLDQQLYSFKIVPTGKDDPSLYEGDNRQVVGDVIYTNVIIGAAGKISRNFALTSGKLLARAINLIPDAPDADIYVDGQKIADKLPFKGISNFVELDSRIFDVAMRKAGDANTTTPIVEDHLQLDAGGAYDIVITGQLNGKGDQSPQINFLIPPSLLPAGKARVAFFHASPDGPAVDLLAGTNVVFQNVAFPQAKGGYLDAGTYNLLVTQTGKADSVLLNLQNTKIEAGMIYVVIAANTASKIEPLILADKSYALMKPAPAPTAVATKSN